MSLVNRSLSLNIFFHSVRPVRLYENLSYNVQSLHTSVKFIVLQIFLTVIYWDNCRFAYTNIYLHVCWYRPPATSCSSPSSRIRTTFLGDTSRKRSLPGITFDLGSTIVSSL